MNISPTELILMEYGLHDYMDSDVLSVEDVNEEITAMASEIFALRRENKFLKEKLKDG